MSLKFIAYTTLKYSERLKYSVHSPKVGQILGRIFSDTDILESSGFFFSLNGLSMENTTEFKLLNTFSPSFSMKGLVCPKNLKAFLSQIFV
jgi:hypothetical protein